MFSPLKLKGKHGAEIPLSVSQVGFLERGNRVLPLKLQSMQQAHQGFVGFGSLGRAILKAPVSQDDVRTDHSLSQVVVERNLRMFQEGQQMKPVSEESFGKAAQAFISVIPACPEEETVFQEPDSPLIDAHPECFPGFFKREGVSENPSQDFVVFQKRFGGILETKPAHLPEEVDETLLFLPGKPVVSRIEIGDENTPVVFGEDLLGDLGSSGLGNPVIGEPFVDNRPEPMASAVYLPPGLIHVKVRALTNRFKDLLDLDSEPLAHPLEGLGQSPFRDLEMSETLEELPDLIEREAVMILQNHGLDEDIGTQVPVRDLFRGIRGRDHLLTMRAVVTVLLETGDFRTGRNEILLNMLKDFLGFAQGMAAVGASLEGLFDHPIDRLRLNPGQSFVSGFLPRRPGALRMLGKPQGLQEFLSGFILFFSSQSLLELFVFLIQLEEFLNELLSGLPETEDFFNQLFFGFLGEEQLAVFSHNPNNGQDEDFFEGIPSGG